MAEIARTCCKKNLSRSTSHVLIHTKPFIKDVEEDEVSRQEMETWMKTKQYDRAAERMKTIRAYDLNLVDRSDFIIAHLVPEVASWGSAEEITLSVRCKTDFCKH